MKEITITIERKVITTITRELSMEVDDNFKEFSNDELDLLLKDEIYDVSNKVDYISLDVDYDVETINNIDNKPIGEVVVKDEYGETLIQRYINN